MSDKGVGVLEIHVHLLGRLLGLRPGIQVVRVLKTRDDTYGDSYVRFVLQGPGLPSVGEGEVIPHVDPGAVLTVKEGDHGRG